jgi:hypothetical protein
MTNETATIAAIKLVLLDAIENGLTTAEDAINYMKTENFEKQVVNYKKLLLETF